MTDRGPTVTVEGARQLRAAMRRAGDDLSDLKKANKEAADIAAAASAALAPVRSGMLKRTVRGAGTKTAGIIRAGNNGRVPYASAIHWGRLWWPNAQGSPRHRSVITPQPFLSEGAQSSEGQWLPVYENYIDEFLGRIEASTNGN
jgi:hypothetical protein